MAIFVVASQSDVDAEVLITPGPDQTNFTADQLGPPFQQGRPSGQTGGPFELSDEMTGFGALNLAAQQQQIGRGFTFPQSLNGSSLGLQQPGANQPNFFGGGGGPQGLSDLQASIQAQALQVAQMQAALAASQQQQQHQQQQTAQIPPRFSQGMSPGGGFDALAAMASMGGFGGMTAGMGNFGGIGGMQNPMLSPMSETFQIQQQIQMLQQQQEALMSRFGDLQAQQQTQVGAVPGAQQSSPPLQQAAQIQQPSPDQTTASPLARVGGAHRRGQSVASGTMGNFGIGGGVSTLGQNGGLGSATSTPKGHGRRHSVQVGGNKAVTISSPAIPGGPNQNTGIQQFTGANESDIYTTGTTPAGSTPTAPVRGHRRGPSMGSISGIGGFQMGALVLATFDVM